MQTSELEASLNLNWVYMYQAGGERMSLGELGRQSLVEFTILQSNYNYEIIRLDFLIPKQMDKFHKHSRKDAVYV